MLKNLFSKLFVIILALGFISCKRVDIENGRVPAEYLAKAQEYMGEYLGKFDGQPGKLILSLDKDYVNVKFIDGIGNDLLGAGCDSKIGDLVYLYVKGDEKNPILTQATFKFNPNKCRGKAIGVSLEIYLSDDNSNKNLGLSIVEFQTVRNVCDGPYPNNCHIEVDNSYLRGQFTKSN